MAERMTEDELQTGLIEALTIAGWRWTHIRRSDGVTMGSPGLPDLIACHPDRELVLAWELKDATRQATPDQAAWLTGMAARPIDARLIRPADYDDALAVIVAGLTPRAGGRR